MHRVAIKTAQEALVKCGDSAESNKCLRHPALHQVDARVASNIGSAMCPSGRRSLAPLRQVAMPMLSIPFGPLLRARPPGSARRSRWRHGRDRLTHSTAVGRPDFRRAPIRSHWAAQQVHDYAHHASVHDHDRCGKASHSGSGVSRRGAAGLRLKSLSAHGEPQPVGWRIAPRPRVRKCSDGTSYRIDLSLLVYVSPALATMSRPPGKSYSYAKTSEVFRDFGSLIRQTVPLPALATNSICILSDIFRFIGFTSAIALGGRCTLGGNSALGKK